MANEHPVLARLLASNFQWASDVSHHQPHFFPTSAKGQSPKVLWIGCSDSRVPESVITASPPGDIFVHRNIANQFHPGDASVLSVLQYAVDFVGVEHVIIAGHTACGGALAGYQAARGNGPVPADSELGQWLSPLVKLATELNTDESQDEKAGLDALTKENVRRQVGTLAASNTITNAWAAGKKVYVHGWLYALDTGLIHDLDISRGPL